MTRNLLLASATLLAFSASVAITPASAAPVFVSALPSLPTLIGALSVGQTYTVSASGIASLCTSCNGGGPLNFTADGKPSSPVFPPYSAVSPNGLDYDPTGSSYPGTGGHGQGGAGKLLGALLGTFTPAPTGPGDFFTIGLNTTLTAPVNETLYGVVNDTFYGDNGLTSGFSVVLTQQAETPPGASVPEPASLALLGAGLLGLSIARRRKAG